MIASPDASSAMLIRVISGTRRRAIKDTVSASIAALEAGVWTGVAASSASIRSARFGRSQSRLRK